MGENREYFHTLLILFFYVMFWFQGEIFISLNPFLCEHVIYSYYYYLNLTLI